MCWVVMIKVRPVCWVVRIRVRPVCWVVRVRPAGWLGLGLDLLGG